MFIETVKASCCYPAHIECSATQTTNRNSFFHEPCKHFNRSVWPINIGVRKTRDETTFHHFRFITYTNLFLIQCCTKATLCKEKFIQKRVIHGAHFNLPIYFKPNAHTTDRDTVCEIHSAVNRIDDRSE